MFARLYCFDNRPAAFFRLLKNCMPRFVSLCIHSVGTAHRRPDTTVFCQRLAGALQMLGLLLLPVAGISQQTITFQTEGKTYRAEVFWVVKHVGGTFQNTSAHTLDLKKDAAFDLEVQFKFQDDLQPPDNDVVWGFQFRQGGNLITPATGEKRARSTKQFQRFQVSGPGNATLTISPKVWQRNAAAQFEIIGQSAPVALGFSAAAATDAAATAPPTTPPPPPTAQPANKPAPAPAPPTAQQAAQQAEAQAYAQALSKTDPDQRTKALLDFIDQYGASGTKSEFVDKALKEVPLGTSLPQRKGAGTVTYTFDYAVRPVVDTANVRGWGWELSEFGRGRYALTLNDLGDTVHTIQVADIGKNAPFNRPRELHPFEKTNVALVGQTRDSFHLKVSGGRPPFVAYLSQKNVPRIRYVLPRTDTTWAFSKDLCTACKGGPHTLEVYTSDFSTLLLRIEGGIKIFKTDYYFLALYTVLSILVLFFAYKPIRRAWQQYQYKRKLRDIESWEKEIEKEERRRRGK